MYPPLLDQPLKRLVLLPNPDEILMLFAAHLVNHKIYPDTNRVCHGHGNTRGVRAVGMAGTGTFWEIPTHGYTVPVTAVSRCHTGTIFACCHTVTQPNMALLHLRLLPPNRSLLSLPLPSHFKNKVSHCSIYKANQYILSRLMIHIIKVSFLTIMYVLSLHLI
jgi:hypothetical protein